MNSYKKYIAIILIFALLFSMSCAGCKKSEDAEKVGFFEKLFGKNKEDTQIKEEVTTPEEDDEIVEKNDTEFKKEVDLPDRPYVIEPTIEEKKVEEKNLSVLLSRPTVTAEKILFEPVVEGQILSATSLTDVANSKTQVDNLKTLKLELQTIALTMDDDDAMPESMKTSIRSMTQKIEFLLTDSIISADLFKVTTGFIGTWTKEDDVLLRWTPQKDWVPEAGYDLYRVIGSNSELIASGLGTEEEINKAVSLGKDFSEYIKPLYDNAKLSEAVLQAAGVEDEAAFNDYAFKLSNPVINTLRFSGEDDFKLQENTTFMVKGTLSEKIPVAEVSKSNQLSIISNNYTLPVSIMTLALIPITKVEPTSMKPVLLDDRSNLITSVISSRSDLLTKANIDMEFANAAGFGYTDSVRGKGLSQNEMIEYILVPKKESVRSVDLSIISNGTRPEGTYSIKVPYGVETPITAPAEVEGYGADDAVYMRWTPPDEASKSTISGYYIERKKNNESGFIQINDVPVTISYTKDEYGIYYEMPYFYSDLDVLNGDSVTYRIRTLDIFGRLSEYSSELATSVYKVTPPNTPNLDQPSLSVSNLLKADQYTRESADLNSGKTGIILPIYKTSADTESFVIYRSEAYGNGIFEAPIEIASVDVEIREISATSRKVIQYRDVKVLMNPASETDVSAVYFDEDIIEGYFYKYWVAAVDDVGNESPWSSGRVVAYPTAVPPMEVLNINAAMKLNIAPNQVLTIPGFESDRLIDISGAISLGKSDYVQDAESKHVSIGLSISETVREKLAVIPDVLSLSFNNLPETNDIHDVIALENDDILAGSIARVSWYHYQGEDLAGYHVYRTYVEGKTIEQLSEMSRTDLVESYNWTKVGEHLSQNLLMDNVIQEDGRIYLYLVFLEPEFQELGIEEKYVGFDLFLPGGWVNLNWEQPQEPQLSHYRVYRQEVLYFEENQDTSSFEWTMVADHLDYTSYTEKVDQTYAHYYYYKITTVSIWGEESLAGEIVSIRVPATSPPQTPSMLIPFAQKGKVMVQWVGVVHASTYVLYRQKIPRIEEEDVLSLQSISPDLFKKILTPQTLNDDYFKDNLIIKNLQGVGGMSTTFDVTSSFKQLATFNITPTTTLPIVSNFNTLQLLSKDSMISNIGQVSNVEKIDVYKTIVDKYGLLAVSPYGQLDYEMAKLIPWEKVNEVQIPLGEESTGVFEFVDENVEFGDTYLYTVQAINDDNLYSGMPDPVSVGPRKAEAFPPVTGVSGMINEDIQKPYITWSSAKDPNLNWEESRDFIAGYIVYKSNSENGMYYQASSLLAHTSFADRNADEYASNWYKVKVVDTGGFISEFSASVKVQKPASFLIPYSNKIEQFFIPQFDITGSSITYNSSSDLQVLPVTFYTPIAPINPIIVPITPIVPIIPIIPPYPDTLTISGFTITGIAASTYESGVGEAILSIGEQYQIPVTLRIRSHKGYQMTGGFVDLIAPITFAETGVYISKLSIDATKAEAKVSGYVKNPLEGNLVGDLFALSFTDEAMNSAGIIKITDVPDFHFDTILLDQTPLATINLGGVVQDPYAVNNNLTMMQAPTLVYYDSFISFIGGKVSTNLGLEILDNKWLTLKYGIIGLDDQKRLNGTMTLDGVQTIKTVVPSGLGIRVTSATLVYQAGYAVASQSSISGKVVLPFNTFEDSLPVEFDPNLLLKTYSDKVVISTDIILHNTMVNSSSNQVALASLEEDIVDRGMYYLASRIQANSLKVLPTDIAAQEKLSTIPFSVAAWDGNGFLIEETTMTPALVGIKGQEIGVTPGKVAVDFSRLKTYSGVSPVETKDPFWVGIVVKNGRIGLPSAYIKTDDNKRVMFNLPQGEFLYDQNGVFYQNQAYSATGIPVNLGESLGGFQDVIVNLIYLDIYDEHVNLEIHGEVGIPLFGYQRAKIRMYTSEETGKYVCTVAETEQFDPAGTGEVLIKILGGHLLPDGLHMDGTIELLFEDKLIKEDMQFTELVVPANMEMMTVGKNTDEVYGRALFDKPYRITFHDFDMDVRALTFNSTSTTMQTYTLSETFVSRYSRDLKLQGMTFNFINQVNFYQSTLSLFGGMQLSDNLSMDSNEDFDRILINNVFIAPTILYEESKSKLDLNFEEFADVKAVTTPVVNEGDDGLVEYNTDSLEMVFNTASSMLSAVPIKANVRLGYDKTMSRYFFALGIYYHDPGSGIQFGYGSLNDITGVIGYNLDLVYDDETGYEFPGSKDGFFNSIDTLEVNRTPGGNYFLAATAWMYFGYEGLSMGEIRNLYLVVEKGPTIEMGGDYYGPSTVQSLVTGKNLKLMGTARLGYYHSERLFQFSLSLYDFGMYGCTVSGDLGFAFSPKFWEIRIGYPNTLEANFGAFSGGMGFTIRDSDKPDDSYIKAKMYFAYDTGDVTIWPVYFRAYLEVGGEGEYYFDSGDIILMIYLEGGMEGGIKVAGKKYRIIHMTVGADGTLTRNTGDWAIDANVRVHYHLDLFLLEVSGSANWHVDKQF